MRSNMMFGGRDFKFWRFSNILYPCFGHTPPCPGESHVNTFSGANRKVTTLDGFCSSQKLDVFCYGINIDPMVFDLFFMHCPHRTVSFFLQLLYSWFTATPNRVFPRVEDIPPCMYRPQFGMNRDPACFPVSSFLAQPFWGVLGPYPFL